MDKRVPVRCAPRPVGRNRLARRRLLGVALAASGVLAGCGMPIASNHPLPPTKVKAKAHRSAPKAQHSPSSSAPSGKKASTTTFPPLVAQALSRLSGQGSLLLWGPGVLPRGNSARTTTGAGSFAVNVFACPTPEPLNSPAMGQGDCGAMASFAESFGSTVYSSASAALAHLPGPPLNSLSGYASRPMALPGNLTGTRWLLTGMSGPGDTLAIRWQEGDWTIWVLGTNVRGAAEAVAVALQQYRLPPHPGVLVVDSAPDGQHTSLEWTVGSAVYQAGASHQAVHAIEMAATGAPLGG